MTFNATVTRVCTQEPACAGESIINFLSNEDTPPFRLNLTHKKLSRYVPAGWVLWVKFGLKAKKLCIVKIFAKKCGGPPGPLHVLFLHENTKKGGAFPNHKRHTAALVVAPPCTPALPQMRQGFRYPPVILPGSGEWGSVWEFCGLP